MPAPIRIHRHRVRLPRNSDCGSARLDELDWTNWWTDTGHNDRLCLHVASLDGKSEHRVYCRYTECPRLRMINGELYWLVEECHVKKEPPCPKT